MRERTLSPFIQKYAKEYPVIALVGPRQSGKTTLAQALFPGHVYLSLENLDLRQHAMQDPRGFLQNFGQDLILDEIQQAPLLLSYLQEICDRNQRKGQFILTGSQQFLLLPTISQSLAGRIALFKLFPFTVHELYPKPGQQTFENLWTFTLPSEPYHRPTPYSTLSLVHTGFYPRIHDQGLEPRKWLENYVVTYLERDIRQVINVKDLHVFEVFLQCCAAHSGQLLKYAAIANTVGISEPTVKKWISLLETSGIVFRLKPHHQNFMKRLVKTPKLYFIDTGLLCYLLAIRDPKQLANHPLYGHIFETFVLSEWFKRVYHLAEIPPFYFWRDQTGNEIDLLVELGDTLFPIEIKASQTYSPHFADAIKKWQQLKGNSARCGWVLYDGEYPFEARSDIPIIPWWMV